MGKMELDNSVEECIKMTLAWDKRKSIDKHLKELKILKKGKENG